MTRGVLLLFCVVYGIIADQRFHFDRAIIPEDQERAVGIVNLPIEVPEKVYAPVAILSTCATGIVGGCCGRSLAFYYDDSDDNMSVATITGVVIGVLAIGLLLQNQRVIRAFNNAYTLCTKKSDQLADNFIEGR